MVPRELKKKLFTIVFFEVAVTKLKFFKRIPNIIYPDYTSYLSTNKLPIFFFHCKTRT